LVGKDFGFALAGKFKRFIITVGSNLLPEQLSGKLK
jgi:hypothetical protein